MEGSRKAHGPPAEHACEVKHQSQWSKLLNLRTQKNKICLLRSFSFPPAPIAWTCPGLTEEEQHFGIRHQFSTLVLQ